MFARLVAGAKEKFGPEIDLGVAGVNAQYWTFGLQSAYNMSVPAPSPDVGDVSDDLNEVQDLLIRKYGEVYLWHDIEHFVGVLRALAFLDLP